MGKQNESGLGAFLGVVGFFAGIAAGSEFGGGTAFVAGCLFAAVGYGVGAVVQKALAYLFFLAVTVVLFLINSAIRHAIFEALSQ